MSRISRRLGAAVLAFCWIAIPLQAPAQFSLGISLGVQVDLAPPPLPVYAQPPVPAPNYIWMPGYWAWGPGGYFWVPGSWVQAPQPGLLWTPGYWAWSDGCGCYSWTPGYWAPQVGFYGGINYGAGYYGNGYVGGRWNDGVFAYNTAVSNVNVTIVHNTYVNRTVIVNNTIVNNHVAYNGGSGGISASPTAEQVAVRNMQHVPATTEQMQHIRTASQDRNLLSSVNHGAPAITTVAHPFSATNHPSDFTPIRPEDRAAAGPHLKGRAGSSPAMHTPMPMIHAPMPMRTPIPMMHTPIPPPHHAPPAVATPHPHPRATRTP